MAEPKKFQFDLPDSGRPTNATVPEEWYPRVQDYWERSTVPRNVDPINGIRAIVIHATAGSNSAGAVSVMAEGRASFHWLIPDEDEPQHGRFIWACAPEHRAAAHVRSICCHPEVNNNATRTNHWSLGIEIVNLANGGDSFSEWQVKITAQLVRYCWGKYPNLKHVVSHAKLDPHRRNDPGINFPWDTFRDLIVTAPMGPIPTSAGVGAKSEEEFDEMEADELH
jgi:N-acetylmuramoyl-L-alanine amidase